jgi:hypothetical protein
VESCHAWQGCREVYYPLVGLMGFADERDHACGVAMTWQAAPVRVGSDPDTREACYDRTLSGCKPNQQACDPKASCSIQI